MWKNYVMDYIKNNRRGNSSIRAGSFIAALFLSFLGCLFYNFWLDAAGGSQKEVPGTLAVFYLTVMAVMCFSLVFTIHSSFAVSMNDRVHQFGIFSSVGATPKQILNCLLQEAFILSALPILFGILLGILLSFGTVRAMSAFAANLAGGREMDFAVHPAVVEGIIFISFVTVLFSAWIPARKLSRLTPLEAIRGTGELQLAKKERSAVLAGLFGIEGELAGNALRTQKKVLRTTSVSLSLAFLGFMLMECFFTLSSISTEHTYFEAFQDAWDVMVTVKDTAIEDFELGEEIQKMQGVESGVIYQKAETVCLLPKEDISAEVLAAGSLEALAGTAFSPVENTYTVKAPFVILDDSSFAAYCAQNGIETEGKGVLLLNRIWDSAGSNFRYPEYLPYIKEDTKTLTFQSTGGAGQRNTESEIQLPVLACVSEPPVLREEYEKSEYPLVQFVPLSLWREVEGRINGAQPELYIRILAKERDSAEEMNALEKTVRELLEKDFAIESENRIQEKKDNDTMIWGYKLILGVFCWLLALIGVAQVFTNTAGFLRIRKREFARYMSVGLTPESMRRIFCIEAVVIAGRPMISSLLLTMAASAVMIKVSYLNPAEFIKSAPAVPVLLFFLMVLGFVGLAYYIGGKRIFETSLADALRDDTLM